MSTIEALEKSRAEVASLKARIAPLDDAPCSHEESRAAILAQCTLWANEGHRLLSYRVRSVGRGDALGPLFQIHAQHGAPVDIGPYLAAILGAGPLAARLSDYLTGTPDGPSAAERVKQRTALVAKLFKAECAEEQAIVALEARGVRVPRRPDADPAAVLALPDGGEVTA